MAKRRRRKYTPEELLLNKTWTKERLKEVLQEIYSRTNHPVIIGEYLNAPQVAMLEKIKRWINPRSRVREDKLRQMVMGNKRLMIMQISDLADKAWSETILSAKNHARKSKDLQAFCLEL